MLSLLRDWVGVDLFKPFVCRGSLSSMPAGSLVVTSFLAVLSLILLATNCPFDSWSACNQFISVYAGIVYLCLLIQSFRRTASLSFYFLILGISFPFFFGRQIVDGFGLEMDRTMLSNNWMSTDILWHASITVLLAVLILHIGYSLFAQKRETVPKEEVRGRWEKSFSYVALRKAGLFVLVLIAIPTLVYLLQNIQLTSEVGYGTRISDSQFRRSGLSNAFGIVAAFAAPVLLANFITRKEGERWQLVVTGVYMILYMMQGSRISVFVLLVTFIYVWYLCFSKCTPSKALAQVMLILISVAVIFSAISFVRASIESTGGDIFSALAERNVLAEALAEAGQTFSVTAKVIDSVPESIPQANGVTFFSGFVYILPNGLTGNYYASVPSVDEVFAQQLVQYGGVGSSFIAEGWYNFGCWSMILFFGYGVLLAKMQNAAERFYRKGSCAAFFACCSCFMFIAFYIRSDTRTFLRNFFWTVLPLIVVQQAVQYRLPEDINQNGVQVTRAS